MYPEEYKYTQEHEWVSPESDNQVRIGITDYAQSQLGDIVFVDLPSQGSRMTQFEKIGEMESVKAVSELFAPISGEVLEINQTIIDNPELINRDPHGAGWLALLKVTNLAELDTLMNCEEYDSFLSGLGEEYPE